MDKIVEAFMKYVYPEPNTGCWLWSGNSFISGYGRLQFNHKIYRAHRLAFSIFVKNIPAGMLVCHKCDIKLCVNPDHLFLGTPQDNMNDKVCKNRQSKTLSEKSHFCKLTKSDVSEIRRLYTQTDMDQYQIAELFQITQSNVSYIIRNQTWSG